MAYELAMRIIQLRRGFPPKEKFALSRQIRCFVTLCLPESASSLGKKKIRVRSIRKLYNSAARSIIPGSFLISRMSVDFLTVL